MNDAAMIRILILIGCVVVINILLFWRQNVDMSENRNDLEAQIFQLQRKRDYLLSKNSDLERQIHRMELKLEHVETQVRDYSQARQDRKNLPQIFFITPTKFRAEQKADLTRLGQTLAHVPNLFWIIVEDSDEPSEMPSQLLERLKFTSSVHIVARTPPEIRAFVQSHAVTQSRTAVGKGVRACQSHAVTQFFESFFFITVFYYFYH
jgi:hypothetical protein